MCVRYIAYRQIGSVPYSVPVPPPPSPSASGTLALTTNGKQSTVKREEAHRGQHRHCTTELQHSSDAHHNRQPQNQIIPEASGGTPVPIMGFSLHLLSFENHSNPLQ